MNRLIEDPIMSMEHDVLLALRRAFRRGPSMKLSTSPKSSLPCVTDTKPVPAIDEDLRNEGMNGKPRSIDDDKPTRILENIL